MYFGEVNYLYLNNYFFLQGLKYIYIYIYIPNLIDPLTPRKFFFFFTYMYLSGVNITKIKCLNLIVKSNVLYLSNCT